MTMTGKQKRALKARGQKMSDDLRLGNAGLTDGFLKHLNEFLQRKELVKLRFTDLEGDARKELADRVSQASGAEVVAIVGKTFLLYRGNPELEAGQRVL